jgi:integrase
MTNGSAAVVSVKLKGVNKVRRKLANGSVRVHYYHRATGLPLRGKPGSVEFIASYAEAERQARERPSKTVQDLIGRYLASANFTKLRPATQTEYRRLLRAVTAEFGDMPVRALNDPRARGDFLEWRDRVAATGKLREAENRLTVFARVLAWGVDRGTVTANPLATWERAYKADRADKIWTPVHIEAFIEVASPGMKLALYLALYTGQRQSDLLSLTWSQYTNGALFFRQAKSRRNVFVPCISRLQTMLDELRNSGEFNTSRVLVTERGRPWLKRHFSRTFKETCDQAGVAGLTFHDLRGTAVTMLAEAGCTEAEIANITGHARKSVSAILEKYMARTTAQSRAAMAKLENSLRTNFANRLQTVSGLFAASEGKGKPSA